MAKKRRRESYPQPYNISFSNEDRTLLGVTNSALEQRAKERLHVEGKHACRQARDVTGPRDYRGVKGGENKGPVPKYYLHDDY